MQVQNQIKAQGRPRGPVEKVFKRGGKTYIQTIEGNSGDRVRHKTYLATSSVINGYGTMR